MPKATARAKLDMALRNEAPEAKFRIIKMAAMLEGSHIGTWVLKHVYDQAVAVVKQHVAALDVANSAINTVPSEDSAEGLDVAPAS